MPSLLRLHSDWKRRLDRAEPGLEEIEKISVAIRPRRHPRGKIFLRAREAAFAIRFANMDDLHPSLSAALGAAPFLPFAIDTRDGRRIEVRKREDAVLNSIALSVCEAPFSVTVIGLDQIQRVIPPDA